MEDPFLRAMFDEAVLAAQPGRCVPPHLPPPPLRRTVVVGCGKAAASMAQAVEEHWQGPLTGLVVTRYDHGLPCNDIEVVEASHPVPDRAGEVAAGRILEAVGGLGEDDLVLCLISGGGSALLALPAPGLTLADKQAMNNQLLKSGATISEINCLRKHLSAIKGGRLAAAAYPAPVVALAISDVPGDDLAVIASGPTVADPTTFADARAVLEKYAITPSPPITAVLEAAADETPKPGDVRLSRTTTILAATPGQAIEAAAGKAREAGYTPIILGDSIEGEARQVAKDQADAARAVAAGGPGAAFPWLEAGGVGAEGTTPVPCVLLSGGETTVTVKGSGRGGRNAEFGLALALALDGDARVRAIACDTDGIDGTEDNAGCLVGPDTLARAAGRGLDAGAMLDNNDGYGFFASLGDLVITGPTFTNVNDFRAIVVDPDAAGS